MSQQLSMIAEPGWQASISECGLYRWWLRRPLKQGGLRVCFILCNPSTADQSENDNTTDSCMRLARGWGAGEVVLVNLFAYRATHPSVLAQMLKHERDGLVKAVGPGNGQRVCSAAKSSDRVVCGWGSLLKPWSKERGEQVRRDLEGIDLWCLGKNHDGAPRHPLYVASGTKLERWP